MLMMPRNNFGMNSIWNSFFSDPFFKNAAAPEVGMKTDIIEKDGNYIMCMDLPGYKKEDISAELKDGYLTVTASRNEEVNDSDESGKYIHRERFTGSCERSFYVGEQVKEEDIKASFENGTLQLAFPKDIPAQIPERKLIAIE